MVGFHHNLIRETNIIVWFFFNQKEYIRMNEGGGGILFWHKIFINLYSKKAF